MVMDRSLDSMLLEIHTRAKELMTVNYLSQATSNLEVKIDALHTELEKISTNKPSKTQ
jgi:hypothetical protein